MTHPLSFSPCLCLLRDGIFSEFSGSNNEEEKALGVRWADIKEQAMDAGVQRFVFACVWCVCVCVLVCVCVCVCVCVRVCV